MSDMTVFICGQKDRIKVQLELPEHILKEFKKRYSKENFGYTPKQVMENILINFINGNCATTTGE